MRILFTGASSFSGYWFVRELAQAGHEVVATFRCEPEAYPDALRRQRASLLRPLCRSVVSARFGDERFLGLVRNEGPWDLLCHHAAEVTNYKSPEFDVTTALANNTRGTQAVLEGLADAGCQRVLLTGSVFENDEGAGSEGLPAFSAYGLSKGLTAQVFRFYAARSGLRLGKFVVANPFGPFEEPRFTAYLAKTWITGGHAVVNTPDYVRDNIHVSLLARGYARFAAELPAAPGLSKRSPSGYPESQGAFAFRFAREMEPRLGRPCPVELRRQTEFSEPRVRINTDLLDAEALAWDETNAWDELAAHYRDRFR